MKRNGLAILMRRRTVLIGAETQGFTMVPMLFILEIKPLRIFSRA
jgi:hypothetical protein